MLWSSSLTSGSFSFKGNEDIISPGFPAAAGGAAGGTTNMKGTALKPTAEDIAIKMSPSHLSYLIRGDSFSLKEFENDENFMKSVVNSNSDIFNKYNYSTSITTAASYINHMFGSNNIHLKAPEPITAELPEFMNKEERKKSIALAKQLAEQALNDEDDNVMMQQTCASRFPCCGVPESSLSPSDMNPDGEMTEETFNRLSSKRANSIVEQRLKRELASGSSVIREASFKIQDAAVSFSSFLSSKKLPSNVETNRPVSLLTYLPPSPLFTFDGRIGVQCMAFKTDFTDSLNNIVPPYFLSEENQLTEQQNETLKKGISFAKEVDWFGDEAVQKLGKQLPRPRRKSLQLLQ